MKYRLNDNPSRPDFNLTIDYKKDLNAEQYAAVTGAEGPCLVLAGAGSGKTRTLIYRVAYLIEQRVAPKNILLVTFTNKAARNMQDRLEILLKSHPRGLWSGTFHHIGNRILRLYGRELGYSESFGILDEEDSRSLVKACIKALPSGYLTERFPKPAVVQSVLSYAANARLDIAGVLDREYPYFLRYAEAIRKVQSIYTARKKSTQTMDYDDLLIQWLHLLDTVPAARQRFSEEFRYILVDEYQDTNTIQAQIIHRLAEVHRNVFVVGDDAQSIYSFRAATIRNILDFPKIYPDAKIFRLETNYRSTPQILELANDSIAKNAEQFPKHLKAVNDAGEKPVIVEPRDLYAQAAFVAQHILELRDEGMELSEIVVLFRAHYQAAELEMELMKRGIPYVVRGGVRFFEQAHVKDALSYMRLAANPFDEISWMRALALEPGIGPGYADRIFREFLDAKAPLAYALTATFGGSVPERARAGLTHFKKVLKPLMDDKLQASPEEAITHVLASGYERYVLTKFENGKDRLDDLKELVNFAHGYKSVKAFLNDVTLREGFRGETMKGSPSHDEVLVLSTIHQAKGLEWKAVFLIGLSENQFPHPKSLEDPKELDEERRLFYVSVTRAREKVYLVHPLTRYDHEMGLVITRRSVFLEELEPALYDTWEIEEGRRMEEGSAGGRGSTNTRVADAIERVIDLDDESFDDVK